MPVMPQPTYDLLDVFSWYEDEDADGNKVQPEGKEQE